MRLLSVLALGLVAIAFESISTETGDDQSNWTEAPCDTDGTCTQQSASRTVNTTNVLCDPLAGDRTQNLPDHDRLLRLFQPSAIDGGKGSEM
ncbi:hypothetical protein GRI97_13195 [Altererythrobacter xixiisoli]|uniref:Uncharacterized protein n=1 Tax=Croceibacterium xixiisoli TaxID=1476466 RepID=A0A6I4U005_9SPHN|nr:hypothetical protein [Croceibacterium xixiisoli]MXO99943.1 hypothetical protein [Croceibacterium xixiisoli]